MVGLLCECGGEYTHVDQEHDGDSVRDTYQCFKCGTYCFITWDSETELELRRVYADLEGDWSYDSPEGV